jgi:hypothetical protein
MNGPLLTIQGSIMPDGTLELDSKLPLPPGRVQVTVAPVTVEKKESSVRQSLDVILEARKSQAVLGRTKQEIDADLQTMRDEWDERDNESNGSRRGIN